MKYTFKHILVDIVKWQGTKFEEYPDWLVDAIKDCIIEEPTGTVVEQPVIIINPCCRIVILPGDYIMYYEGILDRLSQEEVDKFFMRHIIKEKDLNFEEAYHALMNGAFISREVWKERGEVMRWVFIYKFTQIYIDASPSRLMPTTPRPLLRLPQMIFLL